MKKSLLAAAANSQNNGKQQQQQPLSMSYDVSTNSQNQQNQQQQLKHNQSNSLNNRKTLTNFQIQPQTTTTQHQQQFEIIKDVNTRKSVDFKQFHRKNEPSINKLTIQQQQMMVTQSQRVSPDHTIMYQGNNPQQQQMMPHMTGSKFNPQQQQQQPGNQNQHKRQLSVKQGPGSNAPKFAAKQQQQNIFYPVQNNGYPTLEAQQNAAANGKYDSRHSLHIQNKYSSSGVPSYANSQERVNTFNTKQSPAERAAMNRPPGHPLSMSVNEAQYKQASSSQPPTQGGKIFAAYALSQGVQNVGPSPNTTNRALSLSTNLGKPGQQPIIQNVPGGKNKQQSIQSIYSEKNQPQINLPQKQINGQLVPGKGALNQSIDLYRQQQSLGGQSMGMSNLIYNAAGGIHPSQQTTARYQDPLNYGMNGGANSALGHAQNALLLSDANNTNSSYLRQKKAVNGAGGKFASAHSNTPQLNTPNRSLDFSTKACTFFVGNNSTNSGAPTAASGYNFKNQPMKIGQQGPIPQGHKKNAMSLLDYQQVTSGFLDQNLSSIMQQPPQGIGMNGQHRRDFQDISPAAMVAGRFSVQQRPAHGNFTPDLIGKYNNTAAQQQPMMGSTFQQQLFIQQQQQQQMMKLNQSMNSNYGNGGDQILIKKQKKRKGNSYAKTPLDFESSMSSNSALLMMDGGTGSEGINFKQQQLMQQIGIYPQVNPQQIIGMPQNQMMMQQPGAPSYNKKMILRQSQQQAIPSSQLGAPPSDLSSQKGSKISINSLQKSKDRIHQIKQQQDKIKQQMINSGNSSSATSANGGGSTQIPIGQSAGKAQQRYSMLNDSEDQLDKLCLQDVSLTKNERQADGPLPQKSSKAKTTIKAQSKTMNTMGNSTLRKSINITEEALAIGKIPPEDVARMIAKGQVNHHNLNQYSPRTKEMTMIARAIKECFHQLQEAPDTTTDFYRAGKMLGRGAFGKVCLGMHKLTRKLVAIKSINKEYLSEEKQKNKIMHEVGILMRLNRHPNVVKLFETFETGRHILLVMELCAGGDLLNYVRKRKKLEEESAKYLFKQLIEGLGYLHSKNILHRDIKLDNILLDGKGQVKIADFGVSKLVRQGEVMREQCGTPAYIAPEIIRDRGYSGFKADLWSAGVVLYAMLYGTVPFKANNMQDLHKLILSAKYNLKDEISEGAKSLLRALLEPDPVKRFTIKQILTHPWMQGAPDYDGSFVIFNQEEQEIIRKEFTYNNPNRFNRNEVPVNPDAEPWDCFTELNLDSMNATLRNASTKSVILAPFNSSVSDDREFETINKKQAPMVDKKALIKFVARCRDQDRQYEINNNCELDNGVYHKFVYSSHDGAEKQGGAATDQKKPPQQQQSLNGNGGEDDFDLYNNNQIDAAGLKVPQNDRQGLADDGVLSTKMKQSTRNGGKPPGDDQESFIQSFEKPQSDNYEDLERRIQSAKLEKRQTHPLLPNGNQPQENAPQNQKKPQQPPTIEQNNLDDSDTFSSNYSFVIEAERVQTLVDFGFPQEYVYKCLQDNDANYCTAGYYLLGLDQNY